MTYLDMYNYGIIFGYVGVEQKVIRVNIHLEHAALDPAIGDISQGLVESNDIAFVDGHYLRVKEVVLLENNKVLELQCEEIMKAEALK
jgi:hypothetical protein